MDALPLHPMLVHIPLALAALVPLLSLVLYVAWKRKLWPKSSWWIVVVLQAMLVGSAFTAMDTGGDEEETVEPFVGHHAIHEHEEAAEAFTYTALGILFLFVGAGFVSKETIARKLAAAAIAGSVVVMWLGVRTGKAGGELVYEHGAASAYLAKEPHKVAAGLKAAVTGAEAADRDGDGDGFGHTATPAKNAAAPGTQPAAAAGKPTP